MNKGVSSTCGRRIDVGIREVLRMENTYTGTN